MEPDQLLVVDAGVSDASVEQPVEVKPKKKTKKVKE